MKRWIQLIMISSAYLASTGCKAPLKEMNNWETLSGRHDFETAVVAAPDWVREAGRVIVKLEYELERQ